MSLMRCGSCVSVKFAAAGEGEAGGDEALVFAVVLALLVFVVSVHPACSVMASKQAKQNRLRRSVIFMLFLRVKIMDGKRLAFAVRLAV
jgi:hypothetical protein